MLYSNPTNLISLPFIKYLKKFSSLNGDGPDAEERGQGALPVAKEFSHLHWREAPALETVPDDVAGGKNLRIARRKASSPENLSLFESSVQNQFNSNSNFRTYSKVFCSQSNHYKKLSHF